MRTSIISLSKISYQIWPDHPFSQRNRTTERAVGWGGGVEVTGKGGWTKFEKRGGVGNIGGFFIK